MSELRVVPPERSTDVELDDADDVAALQAFLLGAAGGLCVVALIVVIVHVRNRWGRHGA